MPASPPLPPLLEEMLALGEWRGGPQSTVELIKALAPDEGGLHLDGPPFITLEQLVSGEASPFWETLRAFRGADLAALIVIGDFGTGSDSPIVLDHRQAPNDPPVLRVCWPCDGSHWRVMSPSFSSFVASLQLRASS